MSVSEKPMLEDLLTAALNDARTKADAAANAEMQKMTSGIQLPPGFSYKSFGDPFCMICPSLNR